MAPNATKKAKSKTGQTQPKKPAARSGKTARQKAEENVERKRKALSKAELAYSTALAELGRTPKP